MANVVQLINTIHSLFIAHDDNFAVTPNYHVFAIYAAHQGAQSVKTVFAAPSIAYSREGQARALWGLGGSASLREKTLTMTVVNPHATEARVRDRAARRDRARGARDRVVVDRSPGAQQLRASGGPGAARRAGQPARRDVEPHLPGGIGDPAAIRSGLARPAGASP